MDILTLSLAVKKALAAMGVKIEPAKVITFDGDIIGKETYSNMVKVSDEILDLSQTTKIAMYAVEADISEEVSTADLKLLEGVDCAFLMTPDGGVTFVASYSVKKDGFTPGIYVIATEDAYVSRIEFTETIHPIDPKYLPGVCLPVVELVCEIAVNQDFSAENNALMDAVSDSGLPIIARMTLLGGNKATFLMMVQNVNGEITYMQSLGTDIYMIEKRETSWRFSVMSL